MTDSLSTMTHRKFSDWYLTHTQVEIKRKNITKREENEQTNNRERQKVREGPLTALWLFSSTDRNRWLNNSFVPYKKSLEDLANQMSAEIGRKFLLPQHAWQPIILPLIARASVFQWWSLINDAFPVISPFDWLAGCPKSRIHNLHTKSHP